MVLPFILKQKAQNKPAFIILCFFIFRTPVVIAEANNFAGYKYYCVNDILTCNPALVFTMGALEDM